MEPDEAPERPGGGAGRRSNGKCRLRDFDATSVDVILRPNPDVAAHTFDILRIWGERVVIEDVPLTRLGPARPPPAPGEEKQ